MNQNYYLGSFYNKRETLFEKIHNTSTAQKVVMATLMACFTGIMAQIIIPLPWTPVPVTGQTFAVLVAGIALGKKWGGLSQIIYVIGGLIGISWFSGMTGGIGILLGSDGGYLIGFILASFFIGHIIEKYADSRNFKKVFAILSLSTFGLIYIPGLIGLAIWFYLSFGVVPSLLELGVMGLFPFIIGEVFKITGASLFSKIALPKSK
ncbi:MAG: biotin transporter BioY [Methanobacteriaceae archaeon]